MLTTLSIVSLDQGKIWREAHATPPEPEKPVEEPVPARSVAFRRVASHPAGASCGTGLRRGHMRPRRESKGPGRGPGPKMRNLGRQAATRPPRTWSTCCWAFTSSIPLTAATSRVSRSSAAS